MKKLYLSRARTQQNHHRKTIEKEVCMKGLRIHVGRLGCGEELDSSIGRLIVGKDTDKLNN